MSAVLAARELRKSFGSLVVINDVSLHVKAGTRHAVIGPNGAGKTTLFNLLAGQLTPDSGRIEFRDRDITRTGIDARSRAGLARSYQRNNLFRELSVLESLATACAIRAGIGPVFWRRFVRRDAVHARAVEIAELVGIAEDLGTVTQHLSYGTQRQLEVGLALACEPEVLLLDEPTSGMSPEETAEMQRLIERLPKALTVLIIEHDMDVVFGLADRITVLDYGRVLVEGTASEVRGSDAVRERYLGIQPG
ncbi:MAG: ABC transporter ATP-binding protein [Betaproteobacteria bacterium]|nr:ABC transporter ATP-binding protein [Betaproteobacteria bacterium]